MRLEGGQECYIFQVRFEATTVIPCRREERRIRPQRGLLCGPWQDGSGWAEHRGHLLVFLSSSSSLPVLRNRELGGGQSVLFYFYGQENTHTHTHS
jgi:hypothetical protein